MRWVWLIKLPRKCWVVVQWMVVHIAMICTQRCKVIATPLDSMLVVRGHVHRRHSVLTT